MPRPEPQPSSELEPKERFLWTLLGDLVFEDSYALWEAILNVDPVFGELSEEDARRLSAEVVRDLLGREWIYLFSLDGRDPNDAYEQADSRLAYADAERQVMGVLRTNEATGDIWMAPTELGVAAANDPPLAVRRLWGWAEQHRSG